MAKKKVQNASVENGLADATSVYMNGYGGINNPSTIFVNASNIILSNNWVALANTYKTSGFCKTAVDLPVSDAFRNGGFEIDSNTLDSDDLLKLKEFMSDHNDIETLKDCLRFGRLFGGSAIIIDTHVKKTELPITDSELLSKDKDKAKDIDFYPVDRWECFPENQSVQLADKFTLGDLNTKDNVMTFDKSRVLLYTGQLQPFYLRRQLNGWGASIFESIIPELTQYIKAKGVILELLDEAKIDILKIDSLGQVLQSAGGTAKIRKRLEIASDNKNYKSMIAMDTKDDYQQKQLSFGSIDSLLEKIYLGICSSLRMPYSKLFGKGSNGFSSGEDDLENYNSMVEAEIRTPATKILKQMIDIRCMQLFGRKIEDLTINWKPLRILDEKEEQELKKSKIDSYMSLLNAGVMTKKQVAEKLMNENIIMFSEEEIEAVDEREQEEKELQDKMNEQQLQQGGIQKQAKNSLWSKLWIKKK